MKMGARSELVLSGLRLTKIGGQAIFASEQLDQHSRQEDEPRVAAEDVALFLGSQLNETRRRPTSGCAASSSYGLC